jgi:hypothetical protein
VRSTGGRWQGDVEVVSSAAGSGDPGRSSSGNARTGPQGLQFVTPALKGPANTASA